MNPSTKALIEVARRIYGDDDNTRSASFLSGIQWTVTALMESPDFMPVLITATETARQIAPNAYVLEDIHLLVEAAYDHR